MFQNQFVRKILKISTSKKLQMVGIDLIQDFLCHDGSISHFNTYRAVLIVRYAADEKLYLYDVQNIKKD